MSNRDDLIRRIHTLMADACAGNLTFDPRLAWRDALARCGLSIPDATTLIDSTDPLEALLHHAGTRHGFAALAVEDAIRLQANQAA